MNNYFVYASKFELDYILHTFSQENPIYTIHPFPKPQTQHVAYNRRRSFQISNYQSFDIFLTLGRKLKAIIQNDY